MSADEKDALILRVVKESIAAKEELNLLRERAFGVIDDLHAILKSLRGVAGSRPMTFGRGSPSTEIDPEMPYGRLPSGQEIRDLCSQLKDAETRHSELTQRKQSLGI